MTFSSGSVPFCSRGSPRMDNISPIFTSSLDDSGLKRSPEHSLNLSVEHLGPVGPAGCLGDDAGDVVDGLLNGAI